MLAWDWGTSDARRNPPPQGSTAEQLLPHGRRACAVVAGDTAGFGDHRKDSGFAPHRLPHPTWDRAGPSLATRPSLGSPAPGTPEQEGWHRVGVHGRSVPCPPHPAARGSRGATGTSGRQGAGSPAVAPAAAMSSTAGMQAARGKCSRRHPERCQPGAAPAQRPGPTSCTRSAGANANTSGHSPTLAWSPRDMGASTSSRHDSRPDWRALPEAPARRVAPWGAPTDTHLHQQRGLPGAQPYPALAVPAASSRVGAGHRAAELGGTGGAGRVWGARQGRGRGCPAPQAWGADAAAPLRFARPPLTPVPLCQGRRWQRPPCSSGSMAWGSGIPPGSWVARQGQQEGWVAGRGYPLPGRRQLCTGSAALPARCPLGQGQGGR